MLMLVCGPGHAGRESPGGEAAPGAAGHSDEVQKAAAGPASGPPSAPHAAPPPQLPELGPCSHQYQNKFIILIIHWSFSLIFVNFDESIDNRVVDVA